MRGELKVNEISIQNLAKSKAEGYKDCFCQYSTEKWVRMFAGKRFETIKAIQEDDYNIKIPKKYNKIFIDTFTECILPYIEECKLKASNKPKEEKKVKRGRVD